jgi:hypothetical protein
VDSEVAGPVRGTAGLAEDLLASAGPLTGEVMDATQVHAMLALATALASGRRIETGAWHTVAGTRIQDAPAPPLTGPGKRKADGGRTAGRGDGARILSRGSSALPASPPGAFGSGGAVDAGRAPGPSQQVHAGRDA